MHTYFVIVHVNYSKAPILYSFVKYVYDKFPTFHIPEQLLQERQVGEPGAVSFFIIIIILWIFFLYL
jgi:hypothetical protein